MPDEWYTVEKQISKQSPRDLIPEYTFHYNFEIKSNDKITFLGAPEETVKAETPSGATIEMKKSTNVPKREIKIYFKTDNMFKPQL